MLCTTSYSQPNKRTNFWFCKDSVGLNFNSGVPIEDSSSTLGEGYSFAGSSVMSDTNGNLLFYTDGYSVWNRQHQVMPHGNLGNSFTRGTQASLCIPKPESDSQYYIFTSRRIDSPHPMFYCEVDMNLDNGYGDVTDIVNLPDYCDNPEKLAAFYHKNKTDIWVITRSFSFQRYTSLLITKDGINLDPVFSPAPPVDFKYNMDFIGLMKISYDKKYLITCYGGGTSSRSRVEVCSIDSKTGLIDHLYHFKLRYIIPNNPFYRTYSCEFSPDSKYMYLGGTIYTEDITHVYQYDMQYIEDSAQFIQSYIQVGSGQGYRLQLASDGKIYCFLHSPDGNDPSNGLVGIIHKPEKPGLECNYLPSEFFIENGIVKSGLVNFVTDFLFRFDFDGLCESDTFTFDPWFFPEPTYIEWNFGDPLSGIANTSTIPHATHKFSDGGTYEVSVYVEYPSGRIEETSRKVEVEYAPEPDLGPDTSFCAQSGIILNAECGPHKYIWSTGAFGSSQITVSDTGWYWVKVINNAGCFETDSIHIGLFPQAIADTSNLNIIPTTCGGSTGVIKGLSIAGLPPLTYQWIDDLGNPISNSLDIYHLPVGNYTLEVTDGNNCVNSFGPYAITDAGDVLIQSVDYTQEHCGQQDAGIIVNAISGLGDMLFYSIDNGATYFNNQGIFSGLSAGNYAVRVQDSSNCQSVYANNPVIIQNMDAPEIIDVQIGASSVGQSIGYIEISALGGSDTLFYSNDNGTSFQINDGGFYNLAAGFYTCVVADEIGCDTVFIVEVPEEVTIRLQALAGDDEVCPGNAAFVPLYVSNFNDVANFKTTLLYDKSLISCTGFANANILLEDSLEALLFPAEGKVELLWHAPSVTLPDNTVLADLVFESLDPGLSMVAWDGSAGASLFQNSTGLTIPVDYYLGSVRIYQEVFFSLGPDMQACQGDDIEIIPMLWSSNGEVSYLWTEPSGSTSQDETLIISNAQQYHSGSYSLRVTDTLDCYLDESIELIIHPLPTPSFAGQDTVVTEEPVDIDAGIGFASYLWNTGATSQLITAEVEDWYSVLIESQYGCFGQDSVYVLFWEPPQPPEPISEQIYFPNAFTPDGDGLNDEFKAMSQPDNLTSFSMTIFNRWGQMVFETKDITHGWDGTFKGTEAPAGTYVFRLEYSIAGYDFDTNGTVVLVR